MTPCMNSYSQTTRYHAKATPTPAFRSMGRGARIPKSRIRSIVLHERCGLAPDMMGDVLFTRAVNQLATAIRLQGVEEESMVMLGMLESLVLAGEIEFGDFMRRIQNLFPQVMDKLDRTLLAKLLAYVG